MKAMADTEIADDTEQPALEAPAPVSIGGWPDWLRRTVIGVLLVGAFGFAWWMVASSNNGQTNDLDRNVIISLTPNEGAQALRQTEVGANLAAGYDGRLTINGIAIPEDQMVGARDPSLVSPKDFEQNGLRANNHNQVFFKPGAGKVIEKFEPGTVDITLRYFKDGQPNEGVGTVRWSIKVL